MDKYLAVLDFNTGIAQLENVAVIFANNTDEVKDKFLEIIQLNDSVKPEIKVFNLSDITENWNYYF